MWWLTLSLIWWCGTAAIPSPAPPPPFTKDFWQCPEITQQPVVECSCDIPHTLRCTGDKSAMQIIGKKLQSLRTASISLLDCTLQNVSKLSGPLLEGVSLHGLVISSGEIKDVEENSFEGLSAPLQALGLPNNQLITVPIPALSKLPELDRLDLSGNKLKFMDGSSFKGLRNLSFIDLNNNIITKLSPYTFDNLPQLRILRLRGNRLTLSTIGRINSISTIENLDLSENLIIGPLGPKTFSKMESLKDLQLAHNSLSSIKMGALQGLTNLTSLRIQHNSIDVIEDHAFLHLNNLVTLDLAHNRIVAVSGASLAHLKNLAELDLRHNFLRALTADLIQPLKTLTVLKLDENDISIIASDALKSSPILKHLTLLENPLNCDCSLIEFSLWLINSTIPNEDKATAICTTPPSLENALLIQITPDSLLCGEDEQESIMAPLSPQYRRKVNLKDLKFEGDSIKLTWNVEEGASPYTCDAVFIYEDDGKHEVLLESFPIKCNSTEMLNPNVLQVTIPTYLQLQHKYRYCVALFGSEKTDDEVSLILGCSDMIPLILTPSTIQPQETYMARMPRVGSIQANLSASGNLFIDVTIYPNRSRCELDVVILAENILITQRKLNCEDPRYTFVDLNLGPYRICANVIQPGPETDIPKPKCLTVYKKEFHGFTGLDIAFVTIFSFLCIMVIALIWGVRKMFMKPKIQTHQCFLPPECDEGVQHNRETFQIEAVAKIVLIETERHFCYAIILKHGKVGLYDGNLNFLTSYQSIMTREDLVRSEDERKRRNRWITDAVFCSDSLMLVIANTARSIVIYEVSGLNHVPYWLILSTPNILECLSYSPSIERKSGNSNYAQSTLYAGDSNGNILNFNFLRPKSEMLKRKRSDDVTLFYWDDLVKEVDHVKIKKLGKVHQDAIKHIQYYSDLKLLISCSKSTETSVIIKTMDINNKNTEIYKVAKGVSCFTFSTKSKTLITGSFNGIIRLWNTLISKIIAEFMGHECDIVDIQLVESLDLFFSCSIDGVIYLQFVLQYNKINFLSQILKLWNLQEHACIKTVKLNFPCFSIHGKIIEWGINCIFPGPPRQKCQNKNSATNNVDYSMGLDFNEVYEISKKEKAPLKLWQRSHILIACCNFISIIQTSFEDVSTELSFNFPVLPPPPLQNSVLVPSNWGLSEQHAFDTKKPSDTEPMSFNCANFIDEMKFILDRNILEENGLRSDINYKIALLESKKEKMRSKVALGSPYLALDLPDIEELNLSEGLNVNKISDEYIQKINRLLKNAAFKDHVFFSPETSNSKSTKSSIVDLF